MSLECVVSYPGVENILRCSYTLAHGITPGACNMEIAPQDSLLSAEPGPLIWQFGATTLEFDNCKIDLASAELNSEGRIWRLSILDRRWFWAFGSISGDYNRRDDSKKLIAATEKAPQDLAKLCLQAMGESGHDVSALPNTARPHVEWNAETPARALADLAERFGCRVVLGLDGKVRLQLEGEGSDLTIDETVQENSLDVNPPEMPDSITFVCQPTRVQLRLPLRAVGRDTDGTIVPIDSLTYKPAAGWASEDLTFADISNQDARKAAIATVYRWYQVDLTNPITGLPNGLPDITQLEQILPLLDELVQTKYDATTQTYKPLPIQVYGTYWLDDPYNPQNSSTSSHWKYEKDFRLIGKDGIVEFPKQVRQFVSFGSTWKPATLYLECSFTIRDTTTWAPHAYTKTKNTGSGLGTGAQIIKNPSGEEFEPLTLRVYASYSPGNPLSLAGYTDNITEDELDQAAGYYIDGALQQYENTTAGQVTYAGLAPISPDGAIQQVTWNRNENGATTVASLNTENRHVQAPYKKRRLLERVKGALAK